MNTLPTDKKLAVLAALVEGNSLRAITRMTGVHRTTATNLLVRVGEGCAAMMDERFRNLECDNIQIDEIWTFVGKKQARLTPRERNEGIRGDQYVFVALDADTKLVPSWLVGKRDHVTTLAMMRDLACRMKYPPQITTDGFQAYEVAIPFAFGGRVDYAIQIKHFVGTDAGSGRYAPPRVCSTSTTVRYGDPAPEEVSTTYVERQNLTMRMHMRRFTRLTNGFSKKVENLRAAVALHFAWYNFVRVHQTLGVTPAMEAGVTTRLWQLSDLLAYDDQ